MEDFFRNKYENLSNVEYIKEGDGLKIIITQMYGSKYSIEFPFKTTYKFKDGKLYHYYDDLNEELESTYSKDFLIYMRKQKLKNII